MEMQQLNELINNPELLGNETLGEIRSLISSYPYFQTAWLLYLKNLYLLRDPSFKDELRRGALYVADLSVLFYYIEGNKYSVSDYKTTEDTEIPLVHDRTLDLINRFLSEIPNDKGLNSELSIPVDSVMDYSSLLLLNQGNLKNNENVGDTLPLKGQNLIDTFIEKSETGQIPVDNIETSENHGISDEFYEETEESYDYMAYNESDPVMSSDNEEPVNGNGDEYLTETLAKIYVKQKRYDKALEIIKKLNLKYPKKNVYFADQIRFLERLIINAKSK